MGSQDKVAEYLEDGSDNLGGQILMQALKLIDLATLLELEDFALYQWMFQVTDAQSGSLQEMDSGQLADKKKDGFVPLTIVLQNTVESEISKQSKNNKKRDSNEARSYIKTSEADLETIYRSCE